MTFAYKLKTLREKIGISQEGLAKKLDVTKQVISKWERGNGLPNIDNILKISKIFNVTVDELIDYKMELINIDLEENVEENLKNIKGYKNIINFIINKFSDADEIYSLTQEINLSFWQEIFYSLFDIDVALGIHDLIQNGLVYSFYITKGEDQFLVLIKKANLLTKKLDRGFVKRHLVVDGYRYTKMKKIK